VELEAKRDARLGLVEVENEAIFCTRLDEHERLNGIKPPQTIAVPSHLIKANITKKRRRTSESKAEGVEGTTNEKVSKDLLAATKVQSGVPRVEVPLEEVETKIAEEPAPVDIEIQEVEGELGVEEEEEVPDVPADLPSITSGSAVLAWFENDYHPAVVVAAYSDGETGEVATVDVQFDGWGEGEDAFEYGKPVVEIKFAGPEDEHAPETSEGVQYEDDVQFAVTAPYGGDSEWDEASPHEEDGLE